jgi:hypothetical protein
VVAVIATAFVRRRMYGSGCPIRMATGAEGRKGRQLSSSCSRL